MRILALITDTHNETGGGIARYNHDFLSALSLNGSEIRIITNPRQSKIKLKKLFGKFSFVFSAFSIFLKGAPFDFIFCGHLHLIPLAAIFSRLGRTPLWLQLHGIEAWEKPNAVRRWATKQASIVTAVSRYTRKRFLSWSNVSPEAVKVLPNTVDERFQPGPKPDYLLRRHGLVGKKILLTVSRLSSQERYKGHDKVIRIMPRLIQSHPDLVYVIAGEGDDRPRLEAVAREENLNGAVKFVGKVDESELVDIYRAADILVMPSTGEGFGIAFLEAAACGVPIIGGNSDGSLDALLEGKLGTAVTPNDADGLTVAILEGLDSKKVAFKDVEKFSREHFSQFIKALMEKVVSHIGNKN